MCSITTVPFVISAMLRKEWDFLSLTGTSYETNEEADDGEEQGNENCLPGHQHFCW